MAGVVDVPKADLTKADIADFIVSSRHLDRRDKTSLALLHGGDVVTLAVTDTAIERLGSTRAKLVLSVNGIETKNGKQVNSWDWTIGYGDKALTVTNKESKSGSPDLNTLISIDVGERTDDNAKNESDANPGKFNANTFVGGGQTNDNVPKEEFPWWMLIAAVGIGLTVVIILYLWKSGRLSGHAPTSAPAAPGAIPAAAPAPVNVTAVK